ncbi:hypothetical protein PRZ48_000289 [Zasmidium cellare]|uniref:F-box domain-containing protein n=1 Tax=Zasmidium cellare TaxID=395010 RepID=A0ABR0EYG4_ZASCE|nr:hypothetical protein PRZ48_000289 [Zasmidium cellare]
MATPSIRAGATAEHPGGSFKSFPFLNLPSELRNEIYEILVENTPLRLTRRRSDRIIVNPSPLLLVSKQVFKEYSTLDYSAATLETRVIDYDFTHVSEYLDSLSESEIADLISKDSTQPAKRRFRIELVAGQPHDDWKTIIDWLNRMAHPDKAGGKIDFEYDWIPSSWKREWLGFESMDGVIEILDFVVSGFDKEGRAWKEWTRIRAALEEGIRALGSRMETAPVAGLAELIDALWELRGNVVMARMGS